MKSMRLVFFASVVLLSGLMLPVPASADRYMMDRGWHEHMMQQRGMGGHMGMMGGYMGDGGMGMGMMHGGMYPMMNMLDLDQKQRDKLRELMREQRNNHFKLMGEMMDLQDEMAALYDKDVPDAAAIGKLYSKLADKRRQMIEQTVGMHNKMRGMLNKEQLERFDSMRRGGGMYRGMGGHMGMMGGMHRME